MRKIIITITVAITMLMTAGCRSDAEQEYLQVLEDTDVDWGKSDDEWLWTGEDICELARTDDRAGFLRSVEGYRSVFGQRTEYIVIAALTELCPRQGRRLIDAL